jgi:GLPGLI family protein
MKKFLSFMMVAAIIMGMTSAAMAKDFKGVITYKISYPGMDMDASMAAMMPKLATMTIKDNMAKFEISMGSMGSQMEIINGDDNTVTSCMDMMGQKFYYVETEEDIDGEIEENENVTVDIKDETKEIAGYECQKAVVTVNDNGTEMLFTIYFTDEIGTSSMNMSNPYFADIDGAMLEFEINAGGGTMKMEAISVTKKNVSDDEFEVPEGFVEKTPEEMKQIMGGGM